MALDRNKGFVVVVLCLSSFITLFSTLDTLFLWTDASQQKWGISSPETSRMLAISAGLSSAFVLLFSVYVIYLLTQGESALHLAALLGWYFLAIGIVFGLLSQLGNQFGIDFWINTARGALLLVGVRIAKKGI